MDAITVSQTQQQISGYSIIPMAQEFYLFFFFCVGFYVFRSEAVARFLRPQRQQKDEKDLQMKGLSKVAPPVAQLSSYTAEHMQADFDEGRYERVTSAWSQFSLRKITVESLCIVVNCQMALGEFGEVCSTVMQAVAKWPEQISASLHEVVEAINTPEVVVSRQVITSVLRDLCDKILCHLDVQAAEALLLALAKSNDEARVSCLLQRLASLEAPAYSSTLAAVAQSFMNAKNLDAALGYLQCAFSAEPEPGDDEKVPAQLVTAITRCATENAAPADNAGGRPRPWDVMEVLEAVGDVPQKAFVLILEWAVRQTPIEVTLAHRVERQLRSRASSQPLDTATYEALVRMHAATASTGTAGYLGKVAAARCFDELIEAVASSTGALPSDAALVGMILGCVESRNVELNEHIFNWANRAGRVTAEVFTATTKVLAAAKRHESLCELHKVIASNNLDIDDATFGQLIKSAVQCGQLKLARQMFAQSKNPDAQNFMSLMRACGQEGDVEPAVQMFRDLQSRGEADTSAFNCLLDVYVSCGQVDEAQLHFKDMQASGKVDAVSYNILMKLQAGADKVTSNADADAVVEQMRGQGVKPNTATYNSIISAALQAADFKRAWQTVSQLEAGPGADHYTVSILFKGYKKERQAMDPKAFDQTIGLLAKRHVKIDEVLINVALEACVALRDSARLQRCLQIFSRCGWSVPRQCNSHTYGILIKAHGQNRDIYAAWNLWTEATQERGLPATEQLYGQMIDALVSNGQLDEAVNLFQEMRAQHGDRMESQGFSVAYAMIIRGYAQRKDCDRALQCYEDMKCTNMKVGLVVFNTLIDACCRVGDIDSSAQLFTDMMNADCLPDLITYSTLIKGYCTRGELDKAMELFALMRNKGIVPDAIVFNSLLDGAAKQQMPGLCEEIFHEMVEAGISPSNYSASILIKLHGRCHDVDAAFKVIDELPQKYGFRPNTATYTCLMTTCIANGQLHKAMNLRDRMVKEGCYPDDRTYSTLLRGTLKVSNVEQCLTTIRAALKQGRNLLDPELVQSALSLIQRRRGWDAASQELFEQLRSAGLQVHVPQQGDQPPQQRRQSAQKAENGVRRGSGSSSESGGRAPARTQR